MSTNSPTINSPPSPQEAARELLHRRLARRHLEHFTTYTYPRYVVEPAHALIAQHLDRVVSGDLKRLMVFAPPQHGKSHLVSVHLPAYWLGCRPDDPVILSSYGASLAESKSRQARSIVESLEFARLFPGLGTRSDSRAVNHWQLGRHRGGLLAVGVGGPVTGHGGLLGIIDDPLENWEQAQSQTIRDKIWDWYRTTFRTRIWEAGSIVLIQTRWHEDDLAGRLLADQAQDWTVLRLPALAETQEEREDAARRLHLPIEAEDPLGRPPGEPLCPKRFSQAALASLKKDVGSMAWSAEYQGNPKAAEGNRFKRHWFPIVDAAPAQAKRVRYWDQAGTAGGGCYTAGVLMASHEGAYYVEDVVRGQWSAGERDKVILQTAELDRERHSRSGGASVTQWFEQEPGSGGKESAQSKVRLLAGFSVRLDKVTGSKEVRAEPFGSQAEAGNVRVVRGPWNGCFIEEMCAFPNSPDKDQVDGASGSFNKLAEKKRLAIFA